MQFMNYGIQPSQVTSSGLAPRYLVISMPNHRLVDPAQVENTDKYAKTSWHDLRELYRDIAYDNPKLDYFGDHGSFQAYWPGITAVEAVIGHVDALHDRLSLRRHGIGRIDPSGPTWIPRVSIMHLTGGQSDIEQQRLRYICQEVCAHLFRPFTGNAAPVIILGADQVEHQTVLQILSETCACLANVTWVVRSISGAQISQIDDQQGALTSGVSVDLDSDAVITNRPTIVEIGPGVL